MRVYNPVYRSALFGVFGTLWALLGVMLTFAISLTYFSSLHDLVWHVWDYRFISAAWYLFRAFGMDAVVLVSALLCLWLWIRLLRRYGFTAPGRGRYVERFREWKAGQGGYAAVFVKAAVIVAAVYGADRLVNYCSSLLQLDPVAYYSLGFVRGLFVWTAVEIGPSIALVFSMFALTHALFTLDGYSQLPVRLSAPVAGVACFFIAILAGFAVANRLDSYKTLEDAPGITRGREPVTMVVLGKDASPLTLKEDFPSLLVTTPLFGDERPFSVPYCAANDDAVCWYLGDRTLPTVQAMTAYGYLVSSGLRRLDVPGAIDTLAAAWEDTGEPVYWHLCINYITNGRRNGPRRELLHRLADESRYVITGRSAMKLSPAFARYGETDASRYWYEKGRFSSEDCNTKDLREFRPPSSPPFSDGTIMGRLTVPGTDVGLIRAVAYERFSDDMPEASRPNYLLLSIVDGTRPGPDGSFEFAGLPAGEYVLVLSVPGEGDYTVDNMPGVITLSEESPIADVGRIEVSGGEQ